MSRLENPFHLNVPDSLHSTLEHWESNGYYAKSISNNGQNYIVEFTMTRPAESTVMVPAEERQV